MGNNEVNGNLWDQVQNTYGYNATKDIHIDGVVVNKWGTNNARNVNGILLNEYGPNKSEIINTEGYSLNEYGNNEVKRNVSGVIDTFFGKNIVNSIIRNNRMSEMNDNNPQEEDRTQQTKYLS